MLITRRILTTSDEDLAQEFGRVMDLFSRGFTSTSDRNHFFCSMNAASSRGYSWVEALEYAAGERRRVG